MKEPWDKIYRGKSREVAELNRVAELMAARSLARKKKIEKNTFTHYLHDCYDGVLISTTSFITYIRLLIYLSLL